MRYIYCHPLFDERKCAHRFSYQLREAFRRESMNLERFDYQGTGEADGWFSDVTMESLRNDLTVFINNQDACLIGTRFGATVLFDYCCQNTTNVQTVILIEPIVSGDYADYLFRKQHLKNVMTGNNKLQDLETDYSNIEGYKTSNRFLEQIKNLSLLQKANGFQIKNKLWIMQRSKTQNIHNNKMLADILQNNAIHVTIENFDLPPFWERIPAVNYADLTSRIVECCHA